MFRAACIGMLGLLSALCLAAAALSDQAPPDDEDAAALALPGVVPAALPPHPSTALSFEAAVTTMALRGGGDVDAERASAEIDTDDRLTPNWRFVFADRLDLDRAGSWRAADPTNTLKQAYGSWQPGSALLLDAGRINARQGVAYGYNPTDFLRADAVRVVSSLDPNSLRDERLGTVMLRGEDLWTGGAFSALYAPRLATRPSSAAFSPDLGATNGSGRWMLSLTQALGAGLNPQWLLFGSNASTVQAGVDVTRLLGGSVIAYVEACGGRIPSLWSQAFGRSERSDWRGRAAAGLTVTSANKLSLTLEYEYDGAALGSDAWRAARTGPPQAYALYRLYVLGQQELATREAVFVYASWQDFMLRHLDWVALLRVDLLDHSRLPWTELRYHWAHVDAALRWQDDGGGPTTDFGASATSRTWQMVLDYYY